MRIDAAETSQDDAIRVALEAVESWAESRFAHLTKEGSNVETYFDIPEDATLPLPSDDLTVTKVKVYEYPSSNGTPLSPIQLGLGHGYDMTDNGRLILRPTLVVSPFEGAVASRNIRVYSRVEVFYIGTGVIPKALTEGIAFLAAGHYTDGPRALRGLQSERIGDYSYTLNPGSDEEGQPSFVARAAWFLTPFMRKQRVRVV